MDDIIKNVDTYSQDGSDFKTQQEAQAKAIVEVVKNNPAAIVNLAIANETKNVIDNDANIKTSITKVAIDNATTAVETQKTGNKKLSKKNYQELHLDEILSMGVNSESSKDKQVTATIIHSIWWYLIYLTIGIIFIAPLSVLLNIGNMFSYKTTAVITVDNEERTVVARRKFGMVATIISIVIFIGYLVGIGFLIASFC